MIRLLHLGREINRGDFVDTVLRGVDRTRFFPMAATFGTKAGIADPCFYEADIPHTVLNIATRRDFLSGARRLAELIRCEKIDIVHAHHLEGMEVASLARIFASFRLIFGRHYSDAIARIPARWKRIGYRLLERTLNRTADAIVSPSTMVHDLLRGSGVSDSKIFVIPYSFDATKLRSVKADAVSAVRQELASPDRVTIATFGRFHPEKGHADLIEAAAQLSKATRKFRLFLVGDGDEKGRLEKRIEQHGLQDQVRFLGWRRDVPAIMSAIDVVVQPSHTECFSQVMLEALVIGRPLVMTQVSGVDDAVTDGRTGLVVRIGDVAGIASALLRLVESAELRSRLGETARQVALARYSADKVIPLSEAVYLGLMEHSF